MTECGTERAFADGTPAAALRRENISFPAERATSYRVHRSGSETGGDEGRIDHGIFNPLCFNDATACGNLG